MHDTLPLLIETDFPEIRRGDLETLQVNIGYKCNQTCFHCHVNAGPDRWEMMEKPNLALIPKVLEARGIQKLDITGGAPEIHEGFRELVRAARKLGVKVIDRCNLTILFEPGHEDLAEFLSGNRVEIVASLPCYSMENVDQQRGNGVFGKSIAALQKLNALGYGKESSDLVINLVYNPLGPALPPNQVDLEADYKRELWEQFGIVFNQLFVLTNMPINRFGSMLVSKGEFLPYMNLLKNSYRAENLDNVMCRSLVSVDWQGYLYDCDFNQMLRIPLKPERNGNPGSQNGRIHLRDLVGNNFNISSIHVADHCWGCTAGEGSSCTGALSADCTD